MNECERYRPQIAGFLDGELSETEAAELNRHLIRCAACREEYETQREASELLERASFREPTDEELAKLWRSPYSRFAWVAGLVLAIGGWLALIAYGIVETLRDHSVELWPKISLAALALGILVLLVLALRERLHAAKTDPYKEIER
jgi:anti-sigma factor RsiW